MPRSAPCDGARSPKIRLRLVSFALRALAARKRRRAAAKRLGKPRTGRAIFGSSPPAPRRYAHGQHGIAPRSQRSASRPSGRDMPDRAVYRWRKGRFQPPRCSQTRRRSPGLLPHSAIGCGRDLRACRLIISSRDEEQDLVAGLQQTGDCLHRSPCNSASSTCSAADAPAGWRRWHCVPRSVGGSGSY